MVRCSRNNGGKLRETDVITHPPTGQVQSDRDKTNVLEDLAPMPKREGYGRRTGDQATGPAPDRVTNRVRTRQEARVDKL